jgi:hypothetical protein
VGSVTPGGEREQMGLDGDVLWEAEEARAENITDALAAPNNPISQLQERKDEAGTQAGRHGAEARDVQPDLADSNGLHAPAPWLFQGGQG